MRTRNLFLAFGTAAVALGAALALVGRTGDGDSPAEASQAGRPDVSRAVEPLSAGRRVRKSSRASRVYPAKPVLSLVADDDGLAPRERALARRIEAALDDEDLPAAVACAKEALNCQNAEIRQAMVDTLGWFGARGLPELTPFLADPDEDVRDSAMTEWSMALADIDDEAEKIGVVEMAMFALTDEDALDEIAGEYIGADEKLAVESLLRVIEGGGSAQGIEKAKETYEFVTGDEFAGRAAAEKWIAEEYEPPDSPSPQEFPQVQEK